MPPLRYNQQSPHFSFLRHLGCQDHGHLQALTQAVHSPEHSSSQALPSVPGDWLVEKTPTLDLRVFQQEQEGVPGGGADCHRPRKQLVNDCHQQVLVSEFSVWVLFLLGETRQRGSENTGFREQRPSTASSSFVREFK